MPLVQIELTAEESDIIDLAAKLERRNRKAQVTEGCLRDAKRVIDEFREARDIETAENQTA